MCRGELCVAAIFSYILNKAMAAIGHRLDTESIGRASWSGSKANAEVLLNITFFYWLQKEAYEKI